MAKQLSRTHELQMRCLLSQAIGLIGAFYDHHPEFVVAGQWLQNAQGVMRAIPDRMLTDRDLAIMEMVGSQEVTLQ